MPTETLFVGQRKRFDLALATPSGLGHPISMAEWRIAANRCSDGSESVRPLAGVKPAQNGLSAEVQAFAWAGTVEIEVTAHAPHPSPAEPAARPRSTNFTQTIVVTIAEVPELAPGLELKIQPAGEAR